MGAEGDESVCILLPVADVGARLRIGSFWRQGQMNLYILIFNKSCGVMGCSFKNLYLILTELLSTRPLANGINRESWVMV